MSEQWPTAKKWGDDISEGRKAELEQRLQTWEAEADHGKRKGPFHSLEADLWLGGADVFWLAARVLAKTGEAEAVESQINELRSAQQGDYSSGPLDLSALNLSGAAMHRANLSGALLNRANLSEASLWEANLSGANLFAANLSKVSLFEATLSEADLSGANLSAANLHWTDLHNANLSSANLSGVDLSHTNLSGANLSNARLNVETDLNEATLSTTTRLVDVLWDGAPLARIAWKALPVVGDETLARDAQHRESWREGKKKSVEERRDEFEAAARAYRLLAVTLRSQGLNEHADRYSYRAQLMQRQVLLRQSLLREDVEHEFGFPVGVKRRRIGIGQRLRNFAAYLGSLLLDLIAGYGFDPLRSFATYAIVVLSFAIGYFLMRDSVHPALNPLDAIIFSITSFHGRGFNPGETVTLHNPLTIVAALEAIIGLLIEITFITTFTQRFFAR